LPQLLRYISGDRHVPVPVALPPAVFQRQARLPSSRAARVPPQSRDGLSFKATRLLEMVQQDPHPSAYFRDSGTDNSRSRTYFRFDYTDRSELCYTGDTHTAQNCKCFVMPDGEAFMQCFSRRRRKTHPRARACYTPAFCPPRAVHGQTHVGFEDNSGLPLSHNNIRCRCRWASERS